MVSNNRICSKCGASGIEVHKDTCNNCGAILLDEVSESIDETRIFKVFHNRWNKTSGGNKSSVVRKNPDEPYTLSKEEAVSIATELLKDYIEPIKSQIIKTQSAKKPHTGISKRVIKQPSDIKMNEFLGNTIHKEETNPERKKGTHATHGIKDITDNRKYRLSSPDLFPRKSKKYRKVSDK